jgi:hypothetical protein
VARIVTGVRRVSDRLTFGSVSPWAVAAFFFGVPLAVMQSGPLIVRFAVASLLGSIGLVVAHRIMTRTEERVPVPAPYPQIVQDAVRYVLADLKHEEHEGEERVGWNHYLGPPYITVLGTAYGLLLLTWAHSTDRAFDVDAIVDTLFSLQCTEGGWASSSQGQQARPESTATVLLALAPHCAGDNRFARAEERLFALLEEPVTQTRLDRTTVASMVLEYLCTNSRHQQQARGLALSLDATSVDAMSGLVAWPVERGGRANVAATARAVTALAMFNELSGDPLARDLARQGSNWLVKEIRRRGEAALAVTTEEIRRYGEHGVLAVRHFTPALVVLAMSALKPMAAATLAARDVAVRRVLAERRFGGIWRWPDTSDDPIWMTYQALLALETVQP